MWFQRAVMRLQVAWILFAVVSILLMGSANAQGPNPVIEAASLRLWPEYDDPGLLVILSGSFSPAATFPLQVAFPVPGGARNIQATVDDPSAGLLSQPWEVVDGKLVYTLPGPRFHIEYYVDRAPSGDQREIAFNLEMAYAISNLEVAVQQPARATGFSLSPGPAVTTVGQDGFTYHTFSRSDLVSGEGLEIVIGYAKTDTGLSAPQLAVTESSAPTEPVPALSRSIVEWLPPWVLIALGATALVAAAVYWLLQRRTHSVAASHGRDPGRSGGAQSTVRGEPLGLSTYCTQCRQPFRPEDRFCARCGAPRRRI